MAYSKKIVFLLLLFFILFSFNFNCFAVEIVNPTESDTETGEKKSFQYDNQYLTLYQIQYSTQQRLIERIYGQLQTSNKDIYYALVTTIFNEVSDMGADKKFIYVNEGQGNTCFNFWVGYKVTMSYDVSNIYDTSQNFVNVPVVVGNVYYVSQVARTGISYPGNAVWLSIPLAYTEVLHPQWVQLFKDCGLITDGSDENTLKNIENATENTKNTVNNINNSVNDVNSSIKDDNVNTDNLGFATDDTTNPTAEGFDTLFNAVYNAFCTTSSEPLVVTLPFFNKSFTIQPNVVSSGMQKAGLGIVVGLINSFYYYVVCLFIYKDISKIVDNLKSGNITSDCGNVKTEVL